MSEYDGLFAKPLRLLFFDIETAPRTSYLWRRKVNGYVGTHMLLTDLFMLSWAAKFSDETKVRSAVLKPSEAKTQDDSRIVDSLSRLMQKADYVVAHNGDKFDIPIVRARVGFNRLEPLGSVQSIDTLKVSSGSFGEGIASHSLDYLSEWWGFDGKEDIRMAAWDGSYRGHGPSLKSLREYNEQDVVVLEMLFHEMKPYAEKLPRLVEFTEYRQEACPYCGKKNRELLDRPHRTNVNSFLRYRCKACKREHRSWQSTHHRKAGSIPV